MAPEQAPSTSTSLTVLEFERLPALGAAYRRGLFVRKPGLRDGATVPPIEARVRSVRPDFERVSAYRQICGFPEAASLPVTYPLVLANAIHAEMILSPAFPAKPLRIIHRGVRVEARAPLPLAADLDFTCRVEGHRETRHGIEMDFLTDVSIEGEQFWNGTSTVLLKRARAGAKAKRRPLAEVSEASAPLRSAAWRLPGNLGRSYAAVTDDYNPIHLWPLTAKLFGFKRPIIHGAWSVARCLTELDRDLPAGPLRFEAQFKRPIFLPGQVLFTAERDDDAVGFAVRSSDGSKLHLTGRAAPL